MDDVTLVKIPIAKVFLVKELAGWLGKNMDVPPGKRGIVIDPEGNARTFPAGRQKVVTPWQRLGGKGIGMTAGYYPPETFEMPLQVSNLLSGDDELVDLKMTMRLKVDQPKNFIEQVVVPAGELREFPQAWIEQTNLILEKFVSQYAAEDLARSLPASRLEADVLKLLEPSLNTLGLQINSIPLIGFQSVEDRFIREAKTAERQEDHPRGTLDENPVPPALPPTRPWLLEKVTTPTISVEKVSPNKAMQAWRRRQIFWIVTMVVIGIIVSYLLYRFVPDLTSSPALSFLIGVWTVIFSMTMATLKGVVEKQEIRVETSRKVAAPSNVDLVLREDGTHLDDLVRKQIGNELKHSETVINDLRQKVYQSGNPDTALKIKAFEKKIAEIAEKTRNVQFGKPPYKEGISLTDADWQGIVAGEENVLEVGKTFTQLAEKVRLSASESFSEFDLKKLENHLNRLEDALANRSRILR